MKLEHKSFYTKYERKIRTVASLIQDTMKNEDVPVAWIDREDTLKALELQQHQGSLAIVSLNKAFDALNIALGITAYDHEFLLVLTNPMIVDIWGEDEEEVEGYLDLDEEEDDEDEELKDEDDDGDDNKEKYNELSVYVCEFCGIYNAYKPKCNKCEIEDPFLGDNEEIDQDDDEEDDDEEDDRNNNIRQLTISPKGLRYDDEGSENGLFDYVCEFCSIYKAVRPRCNKCEVEK